MKDPMPDDERLAALLEGRLSGAERDALLAHLAAHDEDYRVFVESAEILREAEAEEAAEAAEAAGARPREGAAPVPPSAGRRPWPRRVTRWAAAAAVLGLAAGAALATRATAGAADPVRLAARLEHAGEGLPAGWAEQRPWGTTRGAASAEDAGAAARAGALLVDLAVAVEARDSAATWLLTTQLRQRFDPRATPSSPLPRVAAGAGGEPGVLRPLVRDAGTRLEGSLGREPLRVGAWVEAARLAALRRDEAFFRGASTGRMLRRAERFGGGEAAPRVRALLAAEGAPDWEALGGALDALLASVAG